MKRYCFALDLINDSELISEYKKYHERIWPEITDSIQDAGIDNLEIYLTGNRLFMIMEVNDSFSFEKKSTMDLENPQVQAWENLMWKYQQKLPWAKDNEKWILMDKIYQLQDA
ncbi:L-fucose mutarotase, type 2 [Winogradskyella psychrotolerans RS-3]|uniref:L-fucose mutarotase, type 2 n=1 Tax=Winogradskyella psychrotolerans RS-3 TaxID=641526 RepID=S7VJR9_9FLAO|nr:L-rhamnose mutarotase [Winogradskyella psychrotolerans]EPR70460.1 L-fucose mutarotase, type 2 [Winogradskyella psychrotolerans RS-3]